MRKPPLKSGAKRFFFALASSGFSGGNLESIAGVSCHGWQKEVNAVITHKEVRFNTIFDMLILL